MKRLFLLILSFMFLGGAVSSSAFFINNGLQVTETNRGGEFTTSENENLDNVTAKAPTNDGYWTDAGNYATSFAGGSGAESDPYLIETPQQLAYLSYLINTPPYATQYGKLYYKQTADIDLSAYYWVPIGNEFYTFEGNYNGNDYSINNIYINSETNYVGLFGNTNNINLSNLSIYNFILPEQTFSPSDNYSATHFGAFVAFASSGNISNCELFNSELNIKLPSYLPGGVSIGGIIGALERIGSIENCYSYANISALNVSNGNGVGGIVGDVSNLEVVITNCYNYGNVSSSGDTGGIVGSFPPNNSITGVIGNSEITGCANYGDISSSGYYSGGIVGSYFSLQQNSNSFYIKESYNMGNVVGENSVCGILGFCNPNANYFYIENCFNTGEITSQANDGISCGIGSASNYGNTRLQIYRSYNAGKVNGATVYGIATVRARSNGTVSRCVNIGKLTSTKINYPISNPSFSSLSNCYFLKGSSNSQYENATIYGTVCSEEDTKNIDWYINTVGWSSDVWSIVEGVNNGYPILEAVQLVTITYHPNGASGSEVVESKVGSESYTIRSNMFTRSGYNFTGWNTQANGSGQSYSAGSSYTDLANLDLYAQWSRITYTIKYNKNASDATGSMANTTKYYGTNVTLRSNAFKRTGYSFAGWATEKGGNVVYSNGATYTANANVTLYAKWTAHKYTVKFNGNGSTSGSMKEQTFTYGTAQKLTSNAFKKTGFTFSKWTRNADGTGTSYTNGQSVKNLTSTNGATINLYAQWTARNEAKYDSAGKYWYIENGKIPQTKVTNSTLISNLNKATTNGANYYIAGQTLTAKVYSGKEYCKWNNNWYEVEPIKWRLDYSSSQKDGYGTTTDTNAVLAEIVYVDQYSSSSIDAGEGYSNQSVTDFMRNGISTTYLVNYATSTQTFGTGTSLYGTNASTTARMFVSSQSEINAVNGTMNMTFSDLVKDMIKYYGGTNSYFTRDLGSNYNNITCINAVGKEIQRFATDYRGLQFTVRFTEYGCVN